MNSFDTVKKNKTCLCLVLTLLILLGTLDTATGSTFFCMTNQAITTTSSPSVTLENITCSFIYTNQTSARVAVSNDTNNVDVLRLHNQTNEDWRLQLVKFDDSNASRLSNCTIWFRDGATSMQIRILNGVYSQTYGDPFNFTANSNITITAFTNAGGISYIHTYLKILKPNTSTYSLCIVTFEIE